MSSKPTVTEIDACLPQTQCGRCGYPYCIDYAQAIHDGAASVNRCPPGQDMTITMLSALMQVPVQKLDQSLPAYSNRLLAVIDENLCIGCTLCIQACPVDAIVGAARVMHDVIASECTGCELCLPPCPMNCIFLEAWPGDRDIASPWPEYSEADRNRARSRASRHRHRLLTPQSPPASKSVTHQQQMRDDIAAAVARVKAKRGNRET